MGERAEAYKKKKIEDGIGKAWDARPKKMRTMEDWDKFDVDEELDAIEDEDRRSRGLDDREIKNEKIIEIMSNHELSEKEKMEKCMHMTGHADYVHKETEQDKARREQQELINQMQDPRMQPREKMHFLGEAYKKYGGPLPDGKPPPSGGGDPEIADKAKELMAQVKNLPPGAVPADMKDALEQLS